MAGEQAGESGPGGSTLSEVVRRLHTQVFLVAIGIGILLVALAVGGASEAVIPVAIALVVVLVIAVVAWQRDTHRQRPEQPKGGARTSMDADRGGEMKDVEQDIASGDVAEMRAHRGGKITGARQRTTGGVGAPRDDRERGGSTT